MTDNNMIIVHGASIRKSDWERINELVEKKDTVAAVKETRRITELGLEEAINIVESWNTSQDKTSLSSDGIICEATSDKGLIIRQFLARFWPITLICVLVILLVPAQDKSAYVFLGLFYLPCLIYMLCPFWHWKDRICCYSNKIVMGKKVIEFSDPRQLAIDSEGDYVAAFSRVVIYKKENRGREFLNITYIKNQEDCFITAYMKNV